MLSKDLQVMIKKENLEQILFKMNNKGQELLIGGFLIFVFVALMVLLGAIALTGDATNNNGNKNTNSPKLQILNPEKCLNQKDDFIGFKVDCELAIKNLEDKPVELTPKFECYKLSEPNDKDILTAQKDAISSGDQRMFKVSYNNKGREWSCKIIDFGVTNFK